MQNLELLRPEQWIEAFLKRRGLDEPDGRMLFAYRVTDEEFESLCQILGPESAVAQLWSVALQIHGFPAAFVLFAAEWWRRHYRGGAWSWEKIFAALSERSDDWAPPVRNQCIQLGLATWRHGTSVGGRRYIGAIARQGGFPMPLVAEATGQLPAVIQIVLRRAARIGAEFDEILAMVREQGVRLPVSLQADEMFELIASTVESVLSLRHEFGLKDEKTAVHELDARCPDWRERFPLPLDNAAAQALLQGFLQTAVMSSRAQGQAALIEIERILLPANPRVYAIQTRLRFPGEIGADPFASYLRVDAEDLPFRVSFRVECGTSVVQIDARKKLSQPSFSLTATADHWDGPTALGEVTITPSISKSSTDRRTIPGGEELDPDLPWVFAETDGALRLIGIGGVRTRSSAVLVALPDDAEVIDIPSENVAWVGEVAVGDIKRRLCRLESDGKIVTSTGIRFALRLVEAGAEEESLVWVGRRFPHPTKPSLCFYGSPNLERVLADGERVRVPAAELHWRAVGSPNASASSISDPGVYEVTWVQGGEARTRFRLAIIPSQTSLQFRSLPRLGEGEIVLKGVRARQVTVQSILENSCVRSDGGDWSIVLKAAGDPPASVDVALEWPSGGGTLSCGIPFPANGGRFSDASGNVLRDGAVLGLGRLAGCCLRVFDTNPDRPQSYKLSLRLVEPRYADTAHQDIEREIAVPLEAGNTAELRLIALQEEIESLLTLSNALDASVRLVLIAGTHPTSKLDVSRFEAALRIVDGAAELPVTSSHSSDLTKARVVAFSLGDPGRGLVELVSRESEGVPTARWLLDDLDAGGAPWLLAAAQSSSVSFRPTIYAPASTAIATIRTPSCPDSDDEVRGVDFATAAGAADPDQRAQLFRGVWCGLAEDHGAADWENVEQVWELLGHVPLSCLDLWRTIADQPVALVAILLHPWNRIGPEPRANLLKRLVRDVGVVWEVVPLSAWITGFERLYRYCVRLVGEEAGVTLYKGMQDDLTALASAQLPGLKALLPLASLLAAGQPAPRSDPARAVILRRELYDGAESILQNELLRQHTDDAWPNFRLAHKALEVFLDNAPHHIADVWRRHARTLFATQFMEDHKFTVISSPVVLALTILTGRAAEFWREPTARWHLMQQRGFDPEWFASAFDYGVRMSLAVGLIDPKSQPR